MLRVQVVRVAQSMAVSLAVVATAWLGMPGVADGGLGGSGAIAGVVVNAATGAPVADACVAAVQGNTVVTTANTASNGQYTISNLASGRYAVVTCLTTTSLANERSPGVVDVTAGPPVHVKSIALPAGYSISGTVDSATNTGPIPGACVELFGDSVGYTGTAPTTTDANGVFQLTNVATGSYVVTTCLRASSPYANQTAAVTVKSTVPTPGLALSLPLGGAISGIVTDAATAQPLAGIEVTASAQGEPLASNLLLPTFSNTAGHYTISNLAPGPYTISGGEQGNYDFLRPATATVRVGIAVGANLAGTPLGRLSGVVVDAVTRHPVAHVCLIARRRGGSRGVPIYPATSSASGSFVVVGLIAGRYEIATCAVPRGFVPYRSTTLVSVTGLRTTGGVRVLLQPTTR